MALLYGVLKKISGWYVIVFFIWSGWHNLRPGEGIRDVIGDLSKAWQFYIAFALLLINGLTAGFEEDQNRKIAALIDEGNILKGQQAYEAALDRYNKAAKLNRTWRGPMLLYFERGMLYRQMNRIEEAVSDLSKFCEAAKSITTLADQCEKARLTIEELRSEELGLEL